MVTDVCNVAIDNDEYLGAVLHRDAQITKYLSMDELDAALDPANYLGHALKIIDNVLDASRRAGEPT